MSTNRRRGHNFERHIAKLFGRWFPDAKRGYQYRGSDKDCDVVGTPYYIECKYAKKRFKHSLYSIWCRAWRRLGSQSEPILIVSRLAYKPIRVYMNPMVVDSLGLSPERTISGPDVVSCTWDVFAEAMDKRYGVRKIK